MYLRVWLVVQWNLVPSYYKSICEFIDEVVKPVFYDLKRYLVKIALISC